MLTMASIAACSTPSWHAPFAGAVATPAPCLKLQRDDPPRPSLLQMDPVWRTYRVPALKAEVSLPASWDGIITDPSRSRGELAAVKQRDPEVGNALEPWLSNPSPGDFVAQNGPDGPGLNITHKTVPSSMSLDCAATPKNAPAAAYRYQFHDGPGAMTIVPIRVQGQEAQAVGIVRLRRQGTAQIRTLFIFTIPSGDPMQYAYVFWRIADSLSPLPAGAGTVPNPVRACAYLDPELPAPGQPAGGFCAHPVSDSLLLADCVGGRNVPPDGSVLTPYRPGVGDGGTATLKPADGHCIGLFPAGNAVSIHARRLATDVLVILDVTGDFGAYVGVGLRESTAGADWVQIDPDLGASIAEQPAGHRPSTLTSADYTLNGHRTAVLLHADRLDLYRDGEDVASATTSLLGEGQIEVYFGADRFDARADVYHVAMYSPA